MATEKMTKIISNLFRVTLTSMSSKGMNTKSFSKK